MNPQDHDSSRLYVAMIWTVGPDTPGRRVSVVARSLDEAREQLEAEFGVGNVYDLHSEEDAQRPRSGS